MKDTKLPLLSADSIGAIADIARSTRDAERAFSAVGITLQRKPAMRHGDATIIPSTASHVSRTLRGLDLDEPRVVSAVLRAVVALAEIYESAPSADKSRLVRLRHCLAADGFPLDASGDPMAAIRALGAAALDVLLDASAIRVELARLERSLDGDPSLAIGKAKNLIEATAKAVLAQKGQPVGSNQNVPTLVKKAMEVLGVHPDQVDTATSPIVRDILGDLRDIALKIGTLRNKVGDGHGSTSAVTGIAARDSRLAVRAAIAWCAYMLDALSEPGGPLPTPDQSDGSG
ncbi:abortive infection family protein [Herbidospora yilanensis]|uniref:abortive infection family protein n=1 Tax=Herbidospora yilanensis TaxID=354426 RepID=UPI000A04F6E6|nr:abortive infection family protein [Herbidospora yilanensis]